MLGFYRFGYLYYWGKRNKLVLLPFEQYNCAVLWYEYNIKISSF
jgi:hypothetical protein